MHCWQVTLRFCGFWECLRAMLKVSALGNAVKKSLNSVLSLLPFDALVYLFLKILESPESNSIPSKIELNHLVPGYNAPIQDALSKVGKLCITCARWLDTQLSKTFDDVLDL